MRICVDLDGVVCSLKKEGQTYFDVLPVDGAVEKLHQLKNAGHYIILHTARHMKTCNGNQSLAVARIGKMTLDWLEKHGVPYDEIFFGKPWADLYLDDNALRFTGWNGIDGDGSSFPRSTESQVKGN